jgi:uncharacterized protein
MNQWQVAALQPPHLAAIIPWEGASDWYRDVSYHGGILSNLFAGQWNSNQVSPNAHGNGETPYRDPETGGTDHRPPLPEYFVAANLAARQVWPLEDEAYKQLTPIFSRIKVPLLSAGNWGGMGCMGAAISKAISKRVPRISGSESIPEAIMESSTTMSALLCRRGSSITT